jgi:hypothetical protein
MNIIGFLRGFSILSLSFSSIGLMAQTIDSTEIDPNPIEHRREMKDRSILNLKTGTFKFGDSSIAIENFHSVKLEKGWYKNISFRSDLLLLARIETSRGGNGGDTLWLKQSKNIALKKVLSRYNIKKKQNEYRFGPSYDQGMGSHCPPGQCHHFFLAYTKKGEWIEIRKEEDLTKILPEVKNDWDAIFLSAADVYAFEPILANSSANNKLLLFNRRVRDCPITYADKLIQVSKKGVVIELGSNISKVTNLCY